MLHFMCYYLTAMKLLVMQHKWHASSTVHTSVIYGACSKHLRTSPAQS